MLIYHAELMIMNTEQAKRMRRASFLTLRSYLSWVSLGWSHRRGHPDCSCELRLVRFIRQAGGEGSGAFTWHPPEPSGHKCTLIQNEVAAAFHRAKILLIGVLDGLLAQSSSRFQQTDPTDHLTSMPQLHHLMLLHNSETPMRCFDSLRDTPTMCPHLQSIEVVEFRESVGPFPEYRCQRSHGRVRGAAR